MRAAKGAGTSNKQQGGPIMEPRPGRKQAGDECRSSVSRRFLFFFLPRVKTDYSLMLSSTYAESLRAKKNVCGHVSNSVKKKGNKCALKADILKNSATGCFSGFLHF